MFDLPRNFCDRLHKTVIIPLVKQDLLLIWERRINIPTCAQNVLTASRCVPKYQNNMSEFGEVLETMNGINRMRWERKPNYLVTHAHNKAQRRETAGNSCRCIFIQAAKRENRLSIAFINETEVQWR